jgi:membrane protease YdiL (CAAX protease family)
MEWVFGIALLALIGAEGWLGKRLYRRLQAGGPAERERLLRLFVGMSWSTAALAVLYAAATGRFGSVLPFALGAPRLPELASRCAPLVTGALVGGGVGLILPILFPKIAERMMRAGGEYTALLPRSGRERLYCVALAVTAGICEELAFRGALLHLGERLLPGAGLMAPAIGAVAVFGLAHLYQGVRGVLLTGVAGGVLMVIFLATGSLLPGIALHILIDLKLAVVRLPSLSRAATA